MAKKDISGEMATPMLIPTLNRYQHFIECVESLRKNKAAYKVKLVIALDYPFKESYKAGYNKICQYLNQDFDEFYDVEIIRRKVNFGAGRNYAEARASLFQKYERIICSEDDNVFSPDFLEYVLTGLEIYKDREDIFAICGYSYPVSWYKDDNSVVMSGALFSAWGYGLWREKFLKYYSVYNSEYIFNLAADFKKSMELRRRNKSLFFYMVSDLGEPEVHKGDTGISIYITTSNLCCVLPKVSVSRNMGFDGSGLHCKEKDKNKYSFDFSGQAIDTEDSFRYVYNGLTDEGYHANMKILDRFTDLGFTKNIRAFLEYILFRIVGIRKYAIIKKAAKDIFRK